MDVKQTVAGVMVAALAVIGFFGILHVLLEVALRPKQITVAVVLQTRRDAEDLDILLCEARRSSCRGSGRRLLLVVSAELMDGTVGEAGKLNGAYAELVERYGAEVAFFSPPEPPHGTLLDKGSKTS